MFAIILLLFLAAAGLVVWAAFASISGRIPWWAGTSYLVAMIGCAIAAYYATFRYVYFANADTRFHGWPVPTVIFQRDGPDGPWLDFVGPTVVLAYPMNLVLFTLLPAILVLVVYRRHTKTLAASNQDSLPQPDGPELVEGRLRESGNPYIPPVRLPTDGSG